MEFPKTKFNKFPRTNVLQMNMEKPSNIKGKVKIKSIIPINFPIKVLKNNKCLLTKDQDNENDNIVDNERNEVEKKQNIRNLNGKVDFNKNRCICPSIFTSEVNKSLVNSDSISSNSVLNAKNTSIYTENVTRNKGFSEVKICTDKLKIMDIDNSFINLGNIKYTKKKSNKCDHFIDIKNTTTKCIEKNIPCITCDDSDIDSDIEIVEIISTPTKPVYLQNIKRNEIIHGNDCIKSKLSIKSTNGYEIDIYNKLNKDRIFENDKENTKTVKFNKRLVPLNATKILKEASNTSESHENFIKTSITLQKKLKLIPHTKLKTTLPNNNKNIKKLVKKSSMFHVDVNNSNISIKSSTLSTNNNINKNGNFIKFNNKQNSSYIKKDLLTYPEYNSTICIMKKLKNTEKQKLITDFQHLQPSCRNFFYDKVSTALDFAPYESIYKDLINLSVDDNKFPFKLIRSNYPESRDKDIIPKLSDFYKSKYIEQNFIIVNPIVPNPININTLNTFAISNKICTWKITTDKF